MPDTMLTGPEVDDILKTLRAGVRFSSRAPTMTRTESGAFVSNGDGQECCEIVDMVSSAVYVTEWASDRASALDAAIRKAIDAPKPLTPAQAGAAAMAAKYGGSKP